MPQIMPITDLRKTNEISDICHKSQEPIFVTKNGYGDLVVMSIEAYERLITDTQIDAAIAEAETEMKGGAVLMDAREALSGLWRQYAKSIYNQDVSACPTGFRQYLPVYL